MLTNLDDGKIGPGMAVALTLYGALLANLLFIPIAGKLSIRSEAETAVKMAIIEGVLAIGAGTTDSQGENESLCFSEERQRMDEVRCCTERGSDGGV